MASSTDLESVEEIVDEPVTPLPETSSAESTYEFNGSKYSNRSDLELAISLEFLSCIQSQQIIPIKTICDVVMPAFLHYLSKGDLNNNQNASSSYTYRLFQEILCKIEHARKNFEQLKQWEETLDRLIKDLLVLDWNWEGKFSRITEGNAGDSSVHSKEVLPKIDRMVTDLIEHIEAPSSVVPVKRTDGYRGQPPSSNISSTVEGSSDQGLNTNFSGTVSSQEFRARYESLNHQLKNCLLYFSAFPANSKIRKKALTYMWAGEGFINPTAADGISSEEIAAKYFEELATKCFIEPVDMKDSGDFSSCTMHPSIHSAVVSLAKESGFFDFDDEGKPTTDYATSHRACLSGTKGGSLDQQAERVDDHSNHKKLYTLINLDETFPGFPADWFSKANNVTTLCLGSWRSSNNNTFLVENTEFLSSLSDLKLLRCLSLNRIYKIRKLPASIFKFLHHLTILDLKACYDLQELPDSVGFLENLTHLDMSECHLIDHMPKGLSKLAKLLVLKGFVVSGDPTSQDQCTLADLVKLEKLRKLSIYTNGRVTGTEGQLNALSQFKFLQVLTISWTRAPSRAPPRKLVSLKTFKSKRHQNVEVTAPSSLPATLEKLDLKCWPLSAMPRWVNPLELQKLKKLYIRGGKLKELHKEMHWTVKILRLQHLRELEMDWQTAQQLFPRMVYLDKIDCPLLLSFPVDGAWRPDNIYQITGRHS